MQNGMMLGQYGLQIVREGPGIFGVAFGDVGNQVDDVVEGLDRVGSGGGGRDEEDLSLRLILLPLLQELFLVRPERLAKGMCAGDGEALTWGPDESCIADSRCTNTLARRVNINRHGRLQVSVDFFERGDLALHHCGRLICCTR